MQNPDVVVIGAGAAGCVLAYRLARQNLRVLVLEQGPRHDPTTFPHNEFDAVPRLYKHGSPQSTKDNRMSILQGQGVGGSTVINNAIWIRPDLDRVLPEWAERGAHVDRPALTRAYQELEAWLRVGGANPGRHADAGHHTVYPGLCSVRDHLPDSQPQPGHLYWVRVVQLRLQV